MDQTPIASTLIDLYSAPRAYSAVLLSDMYYDLSILSMRVCKPP